MASHAIFQYNVLAIDDTHNTWTNMIVKMNIPRLLGSSDDKEKIGVARPKGPPLRGFRYPVSGRGSRGSRPSRVSGQRPENLTELHRSHLWNPYENLIRVIASPQIRAIHNASIFTRSITLTVQTLHLRRLHLHMTSICWSNLLTYAHS